MPVFICKGLGFWKLVLAGDVTFRMSCLLEKTPAPFLYGGLGSPWQSAGPDQTIPGIQLLYSVWRDGSCPFIIMPGFHFTCEKRLKTLW